MTFDATTKYGSGGSLKRACIGEGSFGRVYDVVQPTLQSGTLDAHSPVSVMKQAKVEISLEHGHPHQGCPRSFVVETNTLALLAGCPGVLPIHDKCASTYSFQMPKANAGDLRNWHRLPHRDETSKFDQAVRVLYSIVRTLSEALTHVGLVHRDIKRENIVIDVELREVDDSNDSRCVHVNNTWVVDWGTSTHVHRMSTHTSVESMQQNNRCDHPPTWTGAHVQTCWYRSPEAYVDMHPTAKIDVWSVGVLALSLLGKRGELMHPLQVPPDDPVKQPIAALRVFGWLWPDEPIPIIYTRHNSWPTLASWWPEHSIGPQARKSLQTWPTSISLAMRDFIRRCLHADPLKRGDIRELLTHSVFHAQTSPLLLRTLSPQSSINWRPPSTRAYVMCTTRVMSEAVEFLWGLAFKYRLRLSTVDASIRLLHDSSSRLWSSAQTVTPSIAGQKRTKMTSMTNSCNSIVDTQQDCKVHHHLLILTLACVVISCKLYETSVMSLTELCQTLRTMHPRPPEQVDVRKVCDAERWIVNNTSTTPIHSAILMISPMNSTAGTQAHQHGSSYNGSSRNRLDRLERLRNRELDSWMAVDPTSLTAIRFLLCCVVFTTRVRSKQQLRDSKSRHIGEDTTAQSQFARWWTWSQDIPERRWETRIEMRNMLMTCTNKPDRLPRKPACLRLLDEYVCSRYAQMYQTDQPRPIDIIHQWDTWLLPMMDVPVTTEFTTTTTTTTSEAIAQQMCWTYGLNLDPTSFTRSVLPSLLQDVSLSSIEHASLVAAVGLEYRRGILHVFLPPHTTSQHSDTLRARLLVSLTQHAATLTSSIRFVQL